ncbi:hypothetical protein MNBD_NITROSPINAE02-1550 [hydrothermal vent metagenome]|uniref:Uncharacterized protein n=1 Tax=hydrothermal vent metagenome TaxID=652676 RepID=A0A3B1BZD6_9ZZZZ
MASKKKKHRAALIGCGRIGSLLEDDPLRGKPASHAGALTAHPKTRIVAACDINPEALKAFSKRWRAPSLYEDYRLLLDKEDIDIVSVAAWTEHHCQIVLEAVKAGVKGIYCEKPIALNMNQARKMVKACDKYRVAMVIGHERRWDARYVTIRNMLESGDLGELKSITGYALGSAVPRLSRRKFGGGPMFHDGTHLVDLFRFFGGDIKSVTGFADRPFGEKFIENTVFGMVRFRQGASGQIIGGGERGYFHFEIDIQTDKARVILGNHTSRLFVTETSSRYTGFKELKEIPFPENGEDQNAFVGGIDDLIKEMETGQTSKSSGRDGYKALEIITALYKSAGNGGLPVNLPL